MPGFTPAVRRALTVLVLMGALLIGLQTAIVSAAPRSQPAAPGTLRVAMPDVLNLDPVALSRFDPHTRDLVENLFIGLTRYDPVTKTIEPALARSWAVSADGLVWTFELRDDINWVRYDPDSSTPVVVRPVVSGDLVYAVQRACDPLRPSPVTANLMAIKGCHTVARAFPQLIDGLFIAREIGVRATGPHTLQIELLFPVGHFLTLLSTPELRPLPREAFSSAESLTRESPLITNGPFVVRSWTATGMQLVRNPFWPDPVQGNLDEVLVSFVGTDQDALALAEAGQIDFARLDQASIAEARQRIPQLLQVAEGRSLILLGFSFERALVQQPEYRRALALAIDRRALIEQPLGDAVLPANRTLPAGTIGALPVDLPTDPEAAQRALAEAGYPGCNNISEPLILLAPDDDAVWSEAAQAITQQWTQVLGCNPRLFDVKAVPRTLVIELGHAIYDPEKTTRSHAWLFTWSADYPDASAWIYDLLHCRYGYLRTGRPCDSADIAMDQALSSTDLAQREQAYAAVQNLFFGPQGTYPIVPLFWTTSAWLQQPALSQVNAVGAARYDLWALATGS